MSRMARMMSATTSRCLARTMAMQSAQLAQKAGWSTLRPSIPSRPGPHLGNLHRPQRSKCSTDMSTTKTTDHLRLTALNMKFARPPAQCKRRAHADWTSSTNGMRDKRTSCSTVTLLKKACMQWGMSQWSAQNGDPLCSSKGTPDPFHTLPSGSEACAILSRRLQAGGRSPAAFQT